MGENKKIDTLVLDAMRLAERAHRTRPQGPHHRKAPEGEDRPAYFIHLAEVGWMLQDARLAAETVAALPSRHYRSPPEMWCKQTLWMLQKADMLQA